jgi:hypothetical protein
MDTMTHKRYPHELSRGANNSAIAVFVCVFTIAVSAQTKKSTEKKLDEFQKAFNFLVVGD